MTNDLKISRELAEKLALPVVDGEKLLPDRFQARAELASLLANYSEEPLGVVDLAAAWVDPYTTKAIACNPQSNDRFAMAAHKDERNGYTQPLYASPPELAELQATISRLETQMANALNLDFERRAEIERLNKQLCVCPSCHGQGEIYSGHDSYQGQWQPPEPDMDKCGECNGDGVIGTPIDLAAALTEIERLKGGQGDPVARVRHSPIKRRVSVDLLKCGLEHGQLLYSSPPAPVALVMSFEFQHPTSKERRTVSLTKQDACDGMEDYFYDKLGEQICQCESVGETNVVDCNCDEYVHDFELIADTACLDKVKELNQ